MAEYEEYTKWSTFWSWAFIFLLAGGLIGWAVLMMFTIPDVPRQWDFGNLETTPGASIYSTVVVDDDPNEIKKQVLNRKSLIELSRAGKYPDTLMIQPLPEGIPMEEVNNTYNMNRK